MVPIWLQKFQNGSASFWDLFSWLRVLTWSGTFLMRRISLTCCTSDTSYTNKYKDILSGIDVSSRYKVARPVRTKQAADIANVIADIYKVRLLTYPKVFQCDNRSELKAEVTKMLQKHGVKIQLMATKYKHMHKAFIDKLYSQKICSKFRACKSWMIPKNCHQLWLSICMDW